MGDLMRPIPFGQMMDWALTEHKHEGTIFGVRKVYRARSRGKLELFGEWMETPIGPAAGPHTQLAQNLVASYVAGSRFFELKTCQVLDGEDLPVAKPCIAAADECYNVEWSTELYVPQAFEEYVKGWFALNLLARELDLGDPDGFIFNMSVGYDLEGIRTRKINDYIEGMRDAGRSPIWATCKQWALANLHRFARVDEAFIESISPKICRSITLSTLHGCPPDEIERIASYLIRDKKLHTYIKCNPTLLGYEFARKTLDELGFDYIVFDDHHFKADLQFADAVPMFQRLGALADQCGLTFGLKITNTFPVTIAAGELPGEEMYMSGRALYPLSSALALRLAETFEGKLRISYSGGADAANVAELFDTGIWPITMATTLLKPGGYNRLFQMAEELAVKPYKPFQGIDQAKLAALIGQTAKDPRYRKPIKPAPSHKMDRALPLLDCFEAPCRDGCPIAQDIPAYLRLVGEGRHLEALEVITERNPLPFITGTICSHRCMDQCARDFYEDSVDIRAVKLQAAEGGYDALLERLRPTEKSGGAVAVIGGGAAGLSAAFFLSKAGRPVTIFEKRDSLGGIVRHVIPAFRIEQAAIEKDVDLVRAMGVEIELGREIKSIDLLFEQGFSEVIVATGAWRPGTLELEEGEALNVLDFLEDLRRAPDTVRLGRRVAVIGGGNTAMDAARAAGRLPGVEEVSLIYRRDKRNMPADEEELQLALEDGVVFRELLAPLALRGGRLSCAVMALGDADASGRRRPVDTGQRREIEVDSLIAAVGERVDSDFYQANGIRVDARGRAVVDPASLETSRKKVYLIGDATRGPATVVEAIADATRCVKAITGLQNDRCAVLNCAGDAVSAREKKGRVYPEIDGSFEPARCLECASVCELCVDVCPNRANVVVPLSGRPQIVHLDYLCNECGNCETFCPYASAPYRDKFTLFARQKDFENSENEGFLLLPGGEVRARLDGEVADYPGGEGLPLSLAGLVRNTVEKRYLLLQD